MRSLLEKSFSCLSLSLHFISRLSSCKYWRERCASIKPLHFPSHADCDIWYLNPRDFTLKFSYVPFSTAVAASECVYLHKHVPCTGCVRIIFTALFVNENLIKSQRKYLKVSSYKKNSQSFIEYRSGDDSTLGTSINNCVTLEVMPCRAWMLCSSSDISPYSHC